MSDEEERRKLIELIKMMDLSKPWEFSWKRYGRRSLSANALYWTWLDTIAERTSIKDHQLNKDDIHDVMRHLFLGYETKHIKNITIESQLKSTASLSPSEFCFFMEKINAWAVDRGILLPTPDGCEYDNYKKAQEV